MPKGAKGPPKTPQRNRVGKVRKFMDSQEAFGGLLGVNFSKKSMSIPPKKLGTNRLPKNMENHAQMVPKWRQNQCKNASKINAKTSSEKDTGNHGKSWYSDV